MNRTMRAGPLLVLLLTAAVYGQLAASDLPTARTTTVLPAEIPGTDGLAIDGPSEADVDEYVHLEVLGLPPIDSSQSLDEALAWTRSIAMRVQQPPESKSVDFDVTLGFRLIPVLSWKLTLDLRANVSGDYAVAFAMPGVDGTAVQLVTHGVRFGSGPVPPPPDPMIEVTPDGPFSSRGPPGGPFTPPTKGYLIANVGQGNVNWSMNVTAPWLQASQVAGVLAAGQSTEVFLSFNEAAKTLPAGFHAAVATVVNVTNGKGTTPRLVALTVEGTPPPPPVDELWGVVIYETDDLDSYGPEVAQVLASERIRNLDSRFYWRLFDKDVQGPDGKIAEEARPWIELVKKENLPMPHLFLVSQDGKAPFNVPLPDDIDEVIKLVRKYLPAKGGSQ